MSRSTRAVVDISALRHNYQRLRTLAQGRRVMALMKADAYGHGALGIASALPDADAFGVAYLGEAVQLREAGVRAPIVLLEGAMAIDELAYAAALDLAVVIHQHEQLQWLKNSSLSRPLTIWLKVDTGMHRLGIAPSEAASVLAELECLQRAPDPKVREVVVMSHLACADLPDHPMTAQQLKAFQEVTRGVGGQRSIANSAGLLLGDDFGFDWVRPGIMLYGGSPRNDRSAEQLGLRAVMKLVAPIIAIRTVAAGESVGYGASWVAERDTRVGIVAVGYGDGYPRHVRAGACVLLHGCECLLLGRVSMDMLAIDLSAVNAQLGDEVELWGPSLPVERVANWAGTINYELFCQITGRVRREYLP
ncbi:Alanine racemase, catabolic [gamma proteobacterium HdN1]|nr:Alanine racemase, catabolic [gamma proteobacterium HdN1]